LTHFVREGVVDAGNNDGGGGMGSNDIYRERAEPVLVLLSDSYSKEKILVGNSRSSSYPAYMSY